jgi:hypothetical protein
VIAIVEQFDILWPFVRRKIVQPFDRAAECPVFQEAQNARDDDRIFQFSLGDVGLTNQGELRVRASRKKPYHRCERGRLVFHQEFALAVSGRKCDEQARKKAGDRSYMYNYLGIGHMLIP